MTYAIIGVGVIAAIGLLLLVWASGSDKDKS